MPNTSTYHAPTEAQHAALARIEAHILAQPIAQQAAMRAAVRRWALQELVRRLNGREWPAANETEAPVINRGL